MGRRKKQSTVEDLMDLTAMAPWWVGVVLAVASYAVLHTYVGRPVAPHPGQTTGVSLAFFWQGLAMAGQFILPIAFWVALACPPSADARPSSCTARPPAEPTVSRR